MYWGIPPETNDFRLRTGPGAAAVIPQVSGYEEASVVHLEQAQQMMATSVATSSSWMGGGGEAMTETSLPMAAYMNVVGAHAQTAAQTITAAGQAHSAAVASSIPYPTVIANRVREVGLESSNVIGQNTPAIIETNIEYGEFWAQNAGAMMGYLSAAAPLIAALSVPLALGPLGADPAGMAAEVASVAGAGAEAGVQGMGNVLQQAATAGSAGVDTGAGVAAGVASGAASAASAGGPGSAAVQAGSSAGQPAAAGQQGQAEAQLMQSAQAMAGPMTSAPQMLQGATSPLSQLTQMPAMLGGQLGGLMGPMMSSAAGGGLGGAPPLSDLAAGGPAAAAGGLGGANGGYAAGGGGGSAVSAALTKPSAGSSAMAGPVGMPSSWWASPNAQALQDRAPAGARGNGPAPGAAMGPGMYGMPGAGSARERQSTREAAEPDKAVLLSGAGGAVPVLTDDGVVYAQGQGV